MGGLKLLQIPVTRDFSGISSSKHGKKFKASIMRIVFLVLSAFTIFALGVSAEANRPLVIFPGIFGSALEAKLDKSTGPHWICEKHADFFRIWVGVMQILPEFVDCWSDNLELHYNAENNTYTNTEGVTIRPIDFGGVEGFDYLDKVEGVGVPGSEYMNKFIDKMESLGYKNHENMIGIPYDWRYPQDELARLGFWDDARLLIENATANSGRKAILFSHSMGVSYMMYFLNRFVTAEWKEKYIHAVFTVSGTFGGAPEPLRAVLSGVNDYFKFGPVALVSPLTMRPLFQTFGGLFTLMPTVLEEWGNTPVAVVAGKEYLVSDIPQLLDLLGDKIATTEKEMFKGVIKYADSYLEDPGVPIQCVYSVFTTQNDTEYQYIYETTDVDNEPEIVYGVGDGTVPIASLSECTKFKSTEATKVFENAGHREIVYGEEYLEYFADVITKMNA